MKARYTENSGGISIEPGTYEARLDEIRIYRAQKFNSEEYEPRAVFIWNIGEDENEQAIRIWDFVRIPRDREGYPVINERSKLFERVTALYGKPVEPATADLEIALPAEYDSPEGLENAPTFEEGREEGFQPLLVHSLVLNGEELLGRDALITVADKNGRSVVSAVTAKPRGRAKPKPISEAAPL